jgi:exodeoxyribonuclease VII small subunit
VDDAGTAAGRGATGAAANKQGSGQNSGQSSGQLAGEDPELGFDQALDRLRQVVARLEQGSLSLEQALLAFEDGVMLSRRGSAILDAAEQRVELLIQQDDGSERRQSFPAGGPASAGQGT